MMVREKILGVMAIAIVLAGCGVTVDERAPVDAAEVTAPAGGSDGPSETDPTDPSTKPVDPGRPSTTIGSDSEDPAVGPLIETYEELGLDPEDARCVAKGIADSYGDLGSQADVLAILEACGLDAGDIADMGEGAGSPEEAFKLGIVTGLKNSGLTEEQADCVADAYVDEYGTDLGPSQTPSQLMALFEGCAIDPSAIDPEG